MSGWRLAARGVLPPRHHQALLDRLEGALGRLAPQVGVAGAASGLAQLLSEELQEAGLGASPGEIRQLSAAIAKGGAAGMAVAILLATAIANETWNAGGETGDEVTVAFASLAARPQLVLQQLWTSCDAPPLFSSDLGGIAQLPPRGRAAAIMTALRPRKLPR